MSKALFNATIIPEILRLISEKYNLSEEKAMQEFYNSATAKALNDIDTGLYGQSALFIFSKYVEEKSA